ncbi:hypothetical protein PXJ20_32040 [Paraburkholderia sp. A1RI_3L]|uniref:hypothetical protein n=1 Tax=Paraburkholderia TaxID=1822464 RepID=UPI003B7B7573
MNLVSVQQALDAASPGRFWVALHQDRQNVFITVRLLGAANLFVPALCRKQVIGASVAAALTSLLADIEDQKDNATLCNMDFADFVVTAGRTAARPF